LLELLSSRVSAQYFRYRICQGNGDSQLEFHPKSP
jgi:hypothetical protein